jgi:hypothetical protein
MSAAKFVLGQIVSTPNALEAMAESGQTPQFFLDRHVAGDWGQVDSAAERRGCQGRHSALIGLHNAERPKALDHHGA